MVLGIQKYDLPITALTIKPSNGSTLYTGCVVGA
jgi:hypothetical protein